MEVREDWRVEVGPFDVLAAQRAWVLARVTGAPVERQHEVRDDYVRISRARHAQAAGGSRSAGTTLPTQRRP